MIYGIDKTQLRVHVIRPVLKYIGLHTQAAENLVLGTALVESHAGFIRQVGAGPALGLWQMEPATHNDIWTNYLESARHSSLGDAVASLATPAAITLGADELIGNLYYGAAMCRIHYRRVPAALPHFADPVAMAAYWKSYYNTLAGAGSVASAIPHFEVACAG